MQFVSNGSKFRIYAHVKIRFTRQTCNYNITLHLKPLNRNKYDILLSLGTVGDNSNVVPGFT